MSRSITSFLASAVKLELVSKSVLTLPLVVKYTVKEKQHFFHTKNSILGSARDLKPIVLEITHVITLVEVTV